MPKLAQASLAIIAGALMVLVLLGAFALGANFSNHPGDGYPMMDGYRGAQAAASADPSTAAGWGGRGGIMGRPNDSDDRVTWRGDMPCLDGTPQPSSSAQPMPTAQPSGS